MKRLTVPALVLFFCLASGAAMAQDPVRSLADLVGARGSSGEAELTARGYEYVKTSKSGDSSYTFWKEARTGRCVTVRTADGRYASIVYAPNADCEGASESVASPASKGKGFETVCGVETGGKTYKYKCRSRNEGCEGEGYCRTILTYPDNELRITWHKNDQIEVESSGMNPQKTKFSARDGQTRFDFGGNTYFFYRSEKRAQQEVAKFKG